MRQAARSIAGRGDPKAGDTPPPAGVGTEVAGWPGVTHLPADLVGGGGSIMGRGEPAAFAA
jgi:hypothetical protein